MKRYDVAVLGGGPGGYVCAIRLGQLGKKVVVIENKFLGGVCLNVGCIPTKILVHLAHVIETLRLANSQFGIFTEFVGYDIEKINQWKNSVVDRLKKGIQSLFKFYGIDTMFGYGYLIPPDKVEVHLKEGGKEIIEVKNVVIATGSRPSTIKGFEVDHEFIWDSDTAIQFTRIPKKMLILGAGAIGLEFSYIYKMFGADVEVFEIMPQILPGMDGEIANELEKILSKKGIKIHKKVYAKEVYRKNSKIQLLVENKEGREEVFEGDVLLVSVGRKPNTEGFKELGISLDDRGFIKVDQKRKTTLGNVFAIGDVTGPPLLAHKASKEGIVAAEVISGINSSFEPKTIPVVVYTQPELASVGLSEEEAKKLGIKTKIGKFPLMANAKALSMGLSYGLVKVIANYESDEIIGIHILSSEASSLVGEALLALEMNANLEDLSLPVHPHPTLTETLMEAADNALKKAIHILNR